MHSFILALVFTSLLLISETSAHKGEKSGKSTTVDYSDCYWVVSAWKAMGKSSHGGSSKRMACCSMTGITCSDIAVIGIKWNRQSLTGSIPKVLAKIQGLVNLTLGGNQLSDSIPSELGTLTKLQHLDLSKNRLSGPVPSSFAQLKNLNVLSLYNNVDLNGTYKPICRMFVFLQNTSVVLERPDELRCIIVLTPENWN